MRWRVSIVEKMTSFYHLVDTVPSGGLATQGTRGHLSIKMSSYQYMDPHVKDFDNPLHLDVVDRYLRRMRDKTIPDEAPPSLESFYPPWVAGIDLP